MDAQESELNPVCRSPTARQREQSPGGAEGGAVGVAGEGQRDALPRRQEDGCMGRDAQLTNQASPHDVELVLTVESHLVECR